MLKVFASRDEKAEAFGALMVLPTPGLALRAFADAVADEKGPLWQYAADYKLYELGSYDEVSGRLEGHEFPKLLCSAASVKETIVAARAPVAVPLAEVRA